MTLSVVVTLTSLARAIVQNALARAVTKTPKHHALITPVLKKIHWLKIPERIEYKVISLTYNTLQSSQPSYLRQLFQIQPPRSPRSSSTLTLLRPSVTSSLKFSNRPIAVAARLSGTNSPQHCDKCLIHPTSSLKPLPLPSLHNSFTPN